LNSISIENSLKTAHVVYPVPDLPMTITLPFCPMTSVSCSVSLMEKLGIYCNSSTNLAALLKSAYLFKSSLLILAVYLFIKRSSDISY